MRNATIRVETFGTAFVGSHDSALVPKRIGVIARRGRHALRRFRFVASWLARKVLGKRVWLILKISLDKAEGSTPIR